MWNRLGGILAAAVVALIVVNAFEAAVFLANRGSAHLYAPGGELPRPSGYLLDGDYRSAASLHAPCYLIRVYSVGCPYCKADAPEFNSLFQRAKAARCRAISVSPMADEADRAGSSSVSRLQYVDMALGGALDPFLTPQTIVLDSRGTVVWAQVGEMDRRAMLDGERALEAYARRAHGY